MRVILGLAALAATVSGQSVTIGGSSNSGISPNFPPVGTTAQAYILIRDQNSGGALSTVTPSIPQNTLITTNNWVIYVANSVTAVYFQINTNQYTAQLQYRWSPNYPSPALNTAYTAVIHNLSAQSYTCDPCAGGTPVTCNTASGPGNLPSPLSGFQCANLNRSYTLINLVASVANQTPNINAISFQLLDMQTNPGPDTTSYSFQVIRQPPPIVGDPQIQGMQGQDFQVHGIPDEIFNMITYPNLQVNARFVYLSSGSCHDNFTACFAHPGTYISEEGIRLGSDKIHIQAGSFKKGLTVKVNGQKISSSLTSVKLGSVEIVNHRRVIIKTPIMSIQISNSDKFLNQETALFDQKLLALGQERHELLVGETFHPEVPLHGLQGQTWRNVIYPSGLEYEGSISDYHVTDGNLYGTSFVFNQYHA